MTTDALVDLRFLHASGGLHHVHQSNDGGVYADPTHRGQDGPKPAHGHHRGTRSGLDCSHQRIRLGGLHHRQISRVQQPTTDVGIARAHPLRAWGGRGRLVGPRFDLLQTSRVEKAFGFYLPQHALFPGGRHLECCPCFKSDITEPRSASASVKTIFFGRSKKFFPR